MNPQTLRQSAVRLIKEKPIVFALAGVAVIALAVTLVKTTRQPVQAYSFYDVKRGDFLVSIVEGGALEAVNEVIIRNEFEGTARIIFIVREGTYVKKGDLLVELDSSQTQDQVNQQQINVEKSQFAVKQAEATLEIQKSIEDSNLQAASNRVEFAETDLKKYIEGEAQQTRRNAQIEITNVLENLQIADDRFQWTERLFKDGFENKNTLDKDRLTVNQTKLRLEQATNALWMVQTYDIPKRRREFEAARDEALANLERAKLQAERRLSQAEADITTQKRTLLLSEEKLQRDKKQLEGTKIYAPQDGLVVYASPGGSGGGGGRGFSSESMIEEGATVRNRQELIKLPDVSSMKMQVKIHESHINQVRVGQGAFVVLDAMPDQRFAGVVNKVAPLPDSMSRFANPDLKVYATEILVTDKLPDVKPGLSARVEIVITNLPDVLTVPMQAVTTRKGKQVVFLASAPDRPVTVTVGQYNTKFIEIASGLKEGDQVMLAPPFDTKDKDMGGAVIAEGETLPPGATNQPGGPGGRIGNRNGGGAPQVAAGDGTPSLNPDGANGFQGDAMGGGRRGGRGGGRGNSQAILQQYDADGDGKLSAKEFEAMVVGMQSARRGGGFGGALTNSPDILNQFDTNADGFVDQNELAAWLRALFVRQGNRMTAPAEPPVN